MIEMYHYKFLKNLVFISDLRAFEMCVISNEITLEYRYRAYYFDSVIAREYSYEIVSLINEMSNNYEAKFHK